MSDNARQVLSGMMQGEVANTINDDLVAIGPLEFEIQKIEEITPQWMKHMC